MKKKWNLLRNKIMKREEGIDGILVAGPVADFMAGVAAVIMVVLEFKKMGKEVKK